MENRFLLMLIIIIRVSFGRLWFLVRICVLIRMLGWLFSFVSCCFSVLCCEVVSWLMCIIGKLVKVVVRCFFRCLVLIFCGCSVRLL